MTPIDDCLRVGDVVNGGNRAVHDADVLMHDFDERREAIGRARCGRHQVVLVVIIEVVVDPADDIQGTFDRRCNQYLGDAL